MLPALLNHAALGNRLFPEAAFAPSLFDDDAGPSPAEPYAPAYDCYETQDAWELIFDLPGVAREDLKVSVEPGQLSIRGSRKAPETREGSYSERRRWAGDFALSLKLGRGLDANQVEATLKDGVLRITVAKAESAKPREIAIQS